jgi:hypothetical protein
MDDGEVPDQSISVSDVAKEGEHSVSYSNAELDASYYNDADNSGLNASYSQYAEEYQQYYRAMNR